MSQPQSARVPTSALTLEYPLSLGVYERYEQAQKAVDFLSDNEFPVQNCLIVGTDLKQVERITGRLTTGRVAAAGALTGLWLGLFVGLVMSLFSTGSTLATILSTLVFGVLFGVIWSLVGYAMTRGRRDFSSVSAVVATRYEVLVEHKHLDRARGRRAGVARQAAAPRRGGQEQIVVRAGEQGVGVAAVHVPEQDPHGRAAYGLRASASRPRSGATPRPGPEARAGRFRRPASRHGG